MERHGSVLAGCRVEQLQALSTADAVALLRAHGIQGTDSELERAAAPYGNHPLSLRLLAGEVANHPARPGDIAVAERIDLIGDLKQRQTHILQVAYERLSDSARTLLSRIACFRSPVAYGLLAKLAEDEATLRDDLGTLLRRGLLERRRWGARRATTCTPSCVATPTTA